MRYCMSHHAPFELLYPRQTAWTTEWEMNREKSFWGWWGGGGGWVSLRQSAWCSNRQEINIYRHSFGSDSIHVRTNKQSLLQTQCPSPLPPPPPPAPHRRPVPRDKAQVKVDKRCLWIFCVTHSNRRLRSPCNYLLTELIPAVKWPAKSMCTQTAAESEVVHAVYLPAPSRPWYTAIIAEPDRKPLSIWAYRRGDTWCQPWEGKYTNQIVVDKKITDCENGIIS